MTTTADPAEPSGSVGFIRFQSPHPDHRGRNIGIFGLVNSLAGDGKLTAEQERFRRANNDWYNAAYANPADTDPTVYDAWRHPRAAAWFRVSATQLTERVAGYLRILAEHGVPCETVWSTDPGRVIYRDADQVVVVPHDAAPVSRP